MFSDHSVCWVRVILIGIVRCVPWAERGRRKPIRLLKSAVAKCPCSSWALRTGCSFWAGRPLTWTRTMQRAVCVCVCGGWYDCLNINPTSTQNEDSSYSAKGLWLHFPTQQFVFTYCVLIVLSPTTAQMAYWCMILLVLFSDSSISLSHFKLEHVGHFPLLSSLRRTSLY